MFTDLYLQTTNPKLSFRDFFRSSILIGIVWSVLFHTVLYTVFCNAVSYIFLGRFLKPIVTTRLVVFLLAVMFSGFFARFLHVKEIYKAYHYNLEKTREHLDKLYVGWIFIS
jgi:hypothetical protein